MKLKTNNTELNRIWPELCDIFDDYRGLNLRNIRKLESLGIKAEKAGSGHYKFRFLVSGRAYNIICSATPSDFQAGRQILRQIRRLYETNGEHI